MFLWSLMRSKLSCFLMLMLLVLLVFQFPMHFAACKSTAWYAMSSSRVITISSLFKQLKGIGHRWRIHCRISLNFFHFRGTCKGKVKKSWHYWLSFLFLFHLFVSIHWEVYCSSNIKRFTLFSFCWVCFPIKFKFLLTKSFHLEEIL